MDSFIPYMGGKSKLASFIISLFPKHLCYVEVFGGACWVLFKKALSHNEVYNDVNADLVNLFIQIRDNLSELQKKIYWLPYSRKLFEIFSKTYQDQKLSNLEKAARFLYINKICFSGQYLSGFSGGPTHSPSWHTTFIENLKEVRKRFDNVIIENLDFENCIEKYDRETTLFYLDPPYFAADATQYYKFVFTKGSHKRLQRNLSAIKGKFILSYEDTLEVRNLYSSFNILETPEIKISSSISIKGDKKDTVNELCITNFETEKFQLDIWR